MLTISQSTSPFIARFVNALRFFSTPSLTEMIALVVVVALIIRVVVISETLDALGSVFEVSLLKDGLVFAHARTVVSQLLFNYIVSKLNNVIASY